MHDPRARSVVYLRHAPYISPSLRRGPGQTRDCWYKSMALMLIFVRYTRHRLGWSAAPLASLSECNRDGSTRFFTLNTDPSRIKQELFLFISRYLASCQHIPLSSILRGCFWLLLIFPNNFENFLRNQYSRSKRRWWHLNKKFIHFLTAFEMGPICDGFLSLKTLVFNSKLTVLNILHLNYR